MTENTVACVGDLLIDFVCTDIDSSIKTALIS